jgi:hypothetical protein
MPLLPTSLSNTARQFRLLVVLDAAERVGLTPLAVGPLHTLAYLTDALAPVWNLPILDGQILKQVQPFFPLLQADVDRLVGRGLLVPSHVRYVERSAGLALDARYSANQDFVQPILEAATELFLLSREATYVREIVYAASGLGLDGIESLTSVDATYSDPVIDVGGLIEVRPDRGLNQTTRVALRFSDLLGDTGRVSGSEMVNLYVRQLYSRIKSA